jgi:hypothetical protein
MYRSLFTAILLLTLSLAQAQDVLDRISRETCDCINNMDKTEHQGESLQMQLGFCMLKAAGPYEKELRKQHKVDLSRLDHGTGERLGQLVGVRMAGMCPEVLMMIVDISEETDAVNAEVVVAQVTGVVTGVRDRQFATILVKDGSGRTVELLRLEHFANADLLSSAGASSLRATFRYVVRELFDPVSGSYKPHNVLVGLEPE